MREHIAQLIIPDLAEIRGPTTERRDPRCGVASRAPGNLDCRPHVAIELIRRLLIDQPHHPLGQTMFGEERILDPRQHIDNRIADAQNVESRFCHHCSHPDVGRAAPAASWN